MERLSDMVYRLGTGAKDTRRQMLCSMIHRPYRIQTERPGMYRSCERSINIIIPAVKQTDKIVLTAHYDTYPRSLGYNDNGSGLAVLLSLQDKVPGNVEIVFTDYEECGGRGSALYLRENKDGILANINVDVVGLGTNVYYDLYEGMPGILCEGYDASYYPQVPFNDSYIFSRYGIPSILFVAVSGPRKNLISEIWNAQHCGKHDNDMGMIRNDAMEKVADIVLGITASKYLHETNQDNGKRFPLLQNGVQEMDEYPEFAFL